MAIEPGDHRRILVVGAYGLIGGYVLSRLRREGAEIVGFGRDIGPASRRFPYVRWLAGDMAEMVRPGDWDKAIEGVDAVVNCAGALQDGPRDSLGRVHVDATLALFRACAAAGIRRVVHVSAAGIARGRPTAFNDAKLAAEDRLKALDLDWVILRPGLVLATAAYGGSALLRGLAAFPFVIPAIRSRSEVQVIAVEDVAEAVWLATTPSAETRISVDLVSAEATTLAELLRTLRGWLGFPAAPVASIPAVLASPAVRLADLAGALGWRSPMRSTTIRQLEAGVTGDGTATERFLGRAPLDLDAMLANWPSGVQERWFARLYFLKPLAVVTLALFWIASGLTGLSRLDAASALLRQAGMAEPVAVALVAGGSLLDMLLGVMVMIRGRCRLALLGMILVTILYLAAATLLQPALWLDPLGPLAKTIPAAILALITLAILEER